MPIPVEEICICGVCWNKCVVDGKCTNPVCGAHLKDRLDEIEKRLPPQEPPNE